MRKIILILILCFSFYLNEAKAQFNSGYFYDRFDSINTLFNINGIKENDSAYFLWDNYSVNKVDKLIGSIERIYYSYPHIIDGYLDSTGNFGFLSPHQLYRFQSGNWISENLPTNYIAKACMVDSSGSICVATYGDSLFKLNNGNWTKFALNFQSTDEHIIGLISGYNHECLVVSQLYSTKRIYKMVASNFVLVYDISTNNMSNIEIDENNYVWYIDGNVLKKRNATNFVTIQIPLTGYLTGFKLSAQTGKFWVQKNYNNTDSLYYFNGSNWQLADYGNGPHSIFKTRQNQILYKNKSAINYTPDDSIISTLKVIDTTSIINVYQFKQALIQGGATSILAWQSAGIDSEIEFLIGTHHGIYLRKGNLNFIPLSYNNIDTSNSLLPTNFITDMAVRDYANSVYFDTIFIGTDKGIFKAWLNYDSLIIYSSFNQQNSNLPSDSITKLVFNNSSPDQELWIGTSNAGLIKMNSNGFMTVFDTLNSELPSNKIKDIVVSEDFICVTTSKGLMIINDTLQQSYTMLNSGLLTEDVNSVNIYRNYGSSSNNQYKYELIVNTNGFGFAIVDTNNIWHYYNTQNQNLDCDTTYYFSKVDIFNNICLIGSSGLKQIYGAADNISSTTYLDFNSYNDDIVADINIHKINCLSFGFRSGILMGNGILSLLDCYGSTFENEVKYNDLKAQMAEGSISIMSDLKGKYNFECYDIHGKIVHQENILLNQNIDIRIPFLSAGIYLIRLYNLNENHTLKVVNSQ